MPRRTTRLATHEAFHICNRAAGELTLFHNRTDYLLFEQTFLEMLASYPINLFAYCLMPNHWHLLAEAEQPKVLTQALHWLGTTHAIRWRRNTDSKGRGAVYQSRFRAHLVRKNEAFYKVAHYIERNPVVAHLCQAPQEWDWSSASSRPKEKPFLAEWPLHKPKEWHRTLQSPLEEDWISRIRCAVSLQKALDGADQS